MPCFLMPRAGVGQKYSLRLYLSQHEKTRIHWVSGNRLFRLQPKHACPALVLFRVTQPSFYIYAVF
jgi:hypothetical protein